MSPRLPHQARLIAEMDTPYRDLLYTNIVPSDEECARIRELVVAPVDEITHLDQDIAALQVTLDRLSRRREKLTEFVEAHLALVSAKRRLPEDILREIFTASLPTERHSLMSRTRDSPLVFTYVCSEWRRVAFSMPRLWTTFHIMPVRENLWTTAKLTSEGVKFWLEKSGSLPLSISVAWSDHSDELHSNAEEGRRVLQTLAGCSRRWEHMRFVLPSPSHFAPLGAVSPMNLPLLKTVVIDAGRALRSPAALDLFGFTNGPMVTGISLQSRFDEPNLSTLVAAPQIRHLSTLGTRIQFSTHLALQLLARCPQLETCVLEMLLAPVHPHTQVSLTHMRRLCIVDSEWPFGGGVATLWENLDLPILQCLEYASTDSASCLLALTHLAGPQRLTSLSLSFDTPFGTEILAECLGLLPNLENLLIHQKRQSLAGRGTIACGVFLVLTASTPAPFALCPRLQSLTCLGIDTGSDQELLALVEARRAVPSPLSQLHVAFPRAREVADIDGQVVAAGISATLWYPTRGSLDFMSNPPQASHSRSSKKPSTRQEHRDADWGPISTGWMAEYAEWAVTPQWAGDVDYIS
ncbi:hypothetical protein C8R46DRAFT_519357 [Mycena filopes]|nr:hypothetical protein C8R46DRAFT_519357 [Mycena filopes]